MNNKYYNAKHKSAVEDGKCNCEQSMWLVDIIKRVLDHWKELDTRLPDIDLFDECVKAVDYSTGESDDKEKEG